MYILMRVTLPIVDIQAIGVNDNLQHREPGAYLELWCSLGTKKTPLIFLN